jgi:glycosyltransferase involved in cell wall biosynthesis
VDISAARLSYLVTDLDGVGTTVQAFTTCTALASRGHDVELVVVRRAGLLADQAPPGLRIVELRPGKGVPTDLGIACALPALIRYLRAHRPQVVWSGAKSMNPLILAARLLSGISARLVLTITNDLYHRSSREDRGQRFSVLVIRVLYRLADRVITLSQGMTDDLIHKEGLPADLFAVIPPPIDLERIRSLAREPVDHPWLQPDGPPVVLNVARVAAQKDQSNLVRAFAQATRSRRDLHLIVVGDYTDETRRTLLDEAKLLGVEQRVDLVGFDPNPYRYMARSAVFALSSLWEGFGIVLAEAMACGCPVAAVDCPYGPSEILQDGRAGVVVPMWNSAALSRAILQQLAAPTPAHVLEKRAVDFDQPNLMDRYDEVLRELTDPVER